MKMKTKEDLKERYNKLSSEDKWYVCCELMEFQLSIIRIVGLLNEVKKR